MSPIKTLRVMKKQPVQIRNNRGFSLLEALLGFLILSIGMLGIASLQAISLKAGKTSVYGSVAMMKVEELFESIRVNPSATALDAYAVAGAGAGTNNNCVGATICSGVELAQEDIYWWKKNLAAGLPGSTTTAITYTAAIPPSKMATMTINVKWDERDKNTGGSISKTYSTTARICTDVPC